MVIQSNHQMLSKSIDAFTGAAAYDITLLGSSTFTGMFLS
jgi:hypothetical protein